MNNIFFDLDGTLIDSKKRLYSLFCEICHKNKFSHDEYWEIKRKGMNQWQLLKDFFNYDDEEIINFRKIWLTKIEEEERLNQDEKINNIEEILAKLVKCANLYIVTNRQNTILAVNEIRLLGLGKFFQKIFVTNQKISKSDMLKSKLKISKSDILIGDTGEDMVAATELGIKSVAVTWGHLNEQVLKKYKPDIIIDHPLKLGNII